MVIVVAGAGLLVARGADAQQDRPDDEAFVLGEQLYQAQCAQCHGGAGRGGQTPRGGDVPALAGRDDLTLAYVDLTMRVGRMPPAGDPFDNRARGVSLSDEERAAVVTYVAAAFGVEGEIPDVGQGDIAQGLEAYARHCAHCHGSGGQGGVAGAGAWTPRIYHLDEIAVVEAIRVGPFEMPAFSEGAVTDEEAASIAAFLREIDDEVGTPVLGLVELNPVFASGFVVVLALVVLAALMVIAGRPALFPGTGGTAAEPVADPVPVTAPPPEAPEAPAQEGTMAPEDADADEGSADDEGEGAT